MRPLTTKRRLPDIETVNGRRGQQTNNMESNNSLSIESSYNKGSDTQSPPIPMLVYRNQHPDH